MKKILYWLPRILSIIFILFIGLFALDAFDGKESLSEIIIGLLMHLIPNFILIAFLIIAWKKEKAGGIIFIILSIVFTIYFHTYKNILIFSTISFPVFLIGILFLINGLKRK